MVVLAASAVVVKMAAFPVEVALAAQEVEYVEGAETVGVVTVREASELAEVEVVMVKPAVAQGKEGHTRERSVVRCRRYRCLDKSVSTRAAKQWQTSWSYEHRRSRSQIFRCPGS